jgi:hypothetical protein
MAKTIKTLRRKMKTVKKSFTQRELDKLIQHWYDEGMKDGYRKAHRKPVI